MDPLTKEKATEFFGKIYPGEHNIPGELKQYGSGWSVTHRGDLATYDYNFLSKMVVHAHDMCIRASIAPAGPQAVKICVHPRQREGSGVERHPELEDHVTSIRGNALKLVGLLRDCWSTCWSGNFGPNMTLAQQEFEAFLKRKNIPFDNQ